MASGRCLLIAYHFPPSAAVGGRRAAHFASRLGQFGWTPQVLTIPDAQVAQIDRGRLADVAGISVETASAWPTLVDGLTALAERRRREAGPAASGQSAAPAGPAVAGPGSESLRNRLRRTVMSFLLLPDGTRGWVVPATWKAIRIIRRDRIEWFMTSCPPYSVHLIGLLVRLATGARWVADFRDPWMTTGWKRLYPTTTVSRRIESWLEKQVIERADLVMFNVDRLREAYSRRYAHVPSGKFVFVPNSVTPGAAPPLARNERFERFTICYTGSLYVGRSPEPVFQALSMLIASGRLRRDDVRVLLVGQCRFIGSRPTVDVVRDHGLEGVVEVRDAVPYHEAFDLVRRSHMALLLAPNLPYQIPAKVYDYLGAGTPVLAVAEDGGTADLLRQTGAGQAFAPDDVNGLAEGIYREVTGTGGGSALAPLTRFDVSHTTEELVGYLARVGVELREVHAEC